MRKSNFIAKFLATIFLTFFILIFIKPGSLNVQATNDINDGITNWTKQTTSRVGQLRIDDDLSLGYAFGLAQNTSGKVTSGGDSTITKDSTSPGVNNIYFSKMNVFLNTSGNYYGSVFQPSYTLPTVNAQEQVSLSSPDFMLVPSNSTKDITARNFAILGADASNNGNAGLKNKEYYIGTDSNGNPAYKIVGDFSRTPGSAGNGTYNLRAELLLRASPTNSAIVHRELYLYNNTSTTQNFTILYGEDTKLGDSDGKSDLVPIYDLGNKQGLYIKNKTAQSDTDAFRLLVTNQLPDGFKYYNGQAFESGGTGNNWVKGLTPATVSGVGAEAKNNPNGTDLLKRNVDTSYILRWDPTTLNPGETAHYGSTMGVVAKPYSIPSPQKSYTNVTTKDGKNRIGDKLKFSLKISNNGYGANWLYKNLTDEIPEGLQIDPTTLKISYNNETATALDPTDYDPETRSLTVSTNKSLTDDQYATVTFDANITNDILSTSSMTMTNTAHFTGLDVNVANSVDKTFKASVDIPVETPDFNFSFTKLVKNLTDDPNSDFKEMVEAKHGDLVEYKIVYKVADDSKDYLQGGSYLSDAIPDGIERVGDATVTGPDGYTYNSSNIDTGIATVQKSESVTIIFKAKVTATSAGIVSNIAKISGGLTSTNQTTGDMISNSADIAVQNVDTFVSVPTLVDFGSANMHGTDTVLTNVRTDGELIVSHPTDTNFKVNVSYDNDDPNSQMKNSNNEALPVDDSGLLFIRQRNSVSTDPGNWTAISKTGTSLQTESFAGKQERLNLTSYVGVGDWQIKLSSNTNPGLYNGILTWSMVDGV